MLPLCVTVVDENTPSIAELFTRVRELRDSILTFNWGTHSLMFHG